MSTQPFTLAFLSLLWCIPGAAAAAPAAAVNDDAAKHRELAEAAASDRWVDAYRYSCTDSVPHNFNNVADVAVEPTMIFDDVALLGDRGTAVFLIKTRKGNVLIDSSYSTKTKSVLLPALKQIHVSPESIKYVLLTHGHADHFGGAAYLQDHFHTRIAASQADWDLMAHPAPPPPNADSWMSTAPPRQDVVLGDGAEISLGDAVFKAFLIPGHTPGALGFVFSVHDHGHAHVAGLFGGTVLGMARLSDGGLRQYIASLQHFAEAAQANHVDVELQNHPLFDDTWIKAEKLKKQRRGEPNPFVVGEPVYQSFLRVISECSQATLADRVATQRN